MTLCIAAQSGKDKRIVTISDFMLSVPSASLDGSTLKVGTFSPSKRWVFLFAGLPSAADPIIRHVQASLAASTDTMDDVGGAFERAFQAGLKHKIEAELLSRYGWSREEFFRLGRDALGDEEFGRLLNDVNRAALGAEFIVAGFEPNGTSRILVADDPGVVHQCEALGFHAIGAGEMIANSHLFTIYNYNLTCTELIYRLCEAKFLGESALGVGERTFITVIHPDGHNEALWPPAIEGIRQIWKGQGRPPVPDEVTKIVIDNLTPWHRPKP